MTLTFAALILLAGPPRFLGPPERKPAQGEPAPLSPGDRAPFFSGPVRNASAAGAKRFDLAELVGPRVAAQRPAKVVLISFFAPDCAACLGELPVLQSLYTQYRGQGLHVVSVTRDPAALFRDQQVTYPVIADPKGTIARQYLGRNPLYPSAALISADGKVASIKKGYQGDPSILLRTEVESTLRQ